MTKKQKKIYARITGSREKRIFKALVEGDKVTKQLIKIAGHRFTEYMSRLKQHGVSWDKERLTVKSWRYWLV